MAQTGYTPIVHYSTTTASATPSAVSLQKGELGLNVTDKKGYTKDGGGNVVQIMSGPDAAETLTNKTLTSPAINGTVTTAGLTLPALTLGGNVSSTGNPSLNIGTGALTAGAGTFSGNSTIAKNTGTATLDPVEFRVSSTNNGADWDTVNPWAKMGIYSNDAGGVGYTFSIEAVRENTAGTDSNVYFRRRTGADVMRFDPNGNVYTYGNTILGDASTDTVQVNGYMGVGGAGDSRFAQYIRSSTLTGATQIGSLVTPVGTSAATTYIAGVLSNATTAAASFTTTDLYQFYAASSTKGAGSTITNLHGVYIADQTQGTNNYGITSAVSSGTNKWNIYASGTAANYFAGNVGIGATPSAWSSGYKVMQIGAQGVYASGSNITHVATNYYRSAPLADTYIASDFASKYTQEGLTHKWYSAPSGTAGNTITFTQVLAVEKDKSIALQGATSQTGAGITFPATQSASSDANTLDDYEEGIFTPTIVGVTTAGVGTYTAQIGRYTKIGNVVYYRITVTWTAHTGTGNMRVGALPFTSNATPGNNPPCSTYTHGVTLTASNVVQCYVKENATQIVVEQYPAGGGASTAVPIDTAGQILLEGHYEI